jgi:hypothetical protein
VSHSIRYAPVGRCVYCGTTDPPLGDEHIIPEGMGGTLILPEASCAGPGSCADKTSAFERSLQRDMYPAVRAYWKLYGKRRKPTRPTAFPVRYESETGPDVAVPIEDYPLNIFLPILPAPGMIASRPLDPDLPTLTAEDFWSYKSTESEKRATGLIASTGASRIAIAQTFVFTDFLKFLAKVAHCYAISYFGPNVIDTSILRKLILAPKGAHTQGALQLIGCAYEGSSGELVTSTANNGEAYTLGLRFVDFENGTRRALVAEIHLFAHTNAPVYEVIVMGGGYISSLAPELQDGPPVPFPTPRESTARPREKN